MCFKCLGYLLLELMFCVVGIYTSTLIYKIPTKNVVDVCKMRARSIQNTYQRDSLSRDLLNM